MSLLEDIQAKAKAEKNKKAMFPTGTISQDHLMETVPEETVGAAGVSQVNGALAPRFDLRLSLLGRTFSGKKTISKRLQEVIGGGNAMKVFSMDEIVREALAYSNPKKEDDNLADPKAKKAPAKGAKEEAPTDIFEGKDTE